MPWFHVTPTGAHPGCVNGWGLFDMNGNVWEIVQSSDGLEHFRGGAYNCSDSELLHRCDYDATWGPSARGFRWVSPLDRRLSMLLLARHMLAKREVRRQLQQLESNHLSFTRPVSRLRVRFLVEHYARDRQLRTEPGVSYLVTTDSATVLFDLGFNRKKEHPSPLRSNLATLGLEATRLDGIFISHNHLDHVGGFAQQRRRTPALDQLEPGSVSGAEVWTPIAMQSQHSCTTVTGPTELRAGIASSGPLPAHLYFLGMIHEQALLVSLEGQGVVLISGCGHPGIVEMVRYTKAITGQEVSTVIGGLHLVVTRGRSRTQKYIAANHPPWRHPGRRGVLRAIEELRALGVRRLAPSAHDSCDAALALMQDVFGEGYIEARAGDELVLDGSR